MYEVAVIGYGGMGEWHTKQLMGMPKEFHVAGIYDIKESRMELARQNGLYTYVSLKGLLEDTIVQAVIIAVPNNFHKKISIQALRAGKDVICEKPVMMCAGELEEVLQVAEETKQQFSVHQNRRWDKDFVIVKKVIEEKSIGTPFYIESRVQGSKGIPGDWRCVKEAGGGMLLDWGVHLIDQIMWMTPSKVTQVFTHMLSVKFPQVDDNFKVLLRFENGLSALIEVDTYTFIPLPRWHVTGDRGTLVVNDFSCEGEIVEANLTEMKWEESIVYTEAGPTKTMAPRPEETVTHVALPSVQTSALDYYRNFRDAKAGVKELIVKPEQALRVMRVIDAVFESARLKRSIDVMI